MTDTKMKGECIIIVRKIINIYAPLTDEQLKKFKRVNPKRKAAN